METLQEPQWDVFTEGMKHFEAVMKRRGHYPGQWYYEAILARIYQQLITAAKKHDASQANAKTFGVLTVNLCLRKGVALGRAHGFSGQTRKGKAMPRRLLQEEMPDSDNEKMAPWDFLNTRRGELTDVERMELAELAPKIMELVADKPNYAQVLQWYTEGMSFVDMAKELNCTRQNAEQLLKRAGAHVRRRLEKDVAL